MESFNKDFIDSLSEKELWLRLSTIDNAELDEAWSEDGCIPFCCVPSIIEEAQYIEQKLGVAGDDHAYANNWEQLLLDYKAEVANGRPSGL